MLEPKPSDPNGVSPLHLAAKNGHIDVIRSAQFVLSVASVWLVVKQLRSYNSEPQSLFFFCWMDVTLNYWCFYCFFIVQIHHQVADPGWYRYQQTVWVWHCITSSCPLWEDRGSALAAGGKSVRLLNVCTYATERLSPQLGEFTPQHAILPMELCDEAWRRLLSILHVTQNRANTLTFIVRDPTGQRVRMFHTPLHRWLYIVWHWLLLTLIIRLG